jgi:hypothetical protein
MYENVGHKVDLLLVALKVFSWTRRHMKGVTTVVEMKSQTNIDENM